MTTRKRLPKRLQKKLKAAEKLVDWSCGPGYEYLDCTFEDDWMDFQYKVATIIDTYADSEYRYKQFLTLLRSTSKYYLTDASNERVCLFKGNLTDIEGRLDRIIKKFEKKKQQATELI